MYAHRSTNTMRLLHCVLVLVVLAFVPMHAQVSSHWGTEFFVSFGSIVSDVQSDSLWVYLVPSRSTTCTISFTTCSDGHQELERVSLSDPQRGVRIGIARSLLEQPYGRSPCGVLHIQSEAPIQVLAFVSDSTDGEATAVFPSSWWGRTYVVPVNLPQGAVLDSAVQDQPIRATIIAHAASDVMITAPDAPLRVNGVSIAARAQHRLFLEAGEQCLIETSAHDSIVAHGILVQASQPVAVVVGGRINGQHLFEQQLAAEWWDTTAFVLRYPQPAGAASIDPDYALVAAIADSTVVRVGDGSVYRLDAGQVVRIPVMQTEWVSSSKPISVLALRRGREGSVASHCLALVPPPSAAVPAAAVLSPQIRSGVFRLYSEQYLTVIADSVARSILRLDGAPWSAPWEPIPGSNWQVSSRRTGDDVHELVATAGMLIPWTIGYGDGRAYATCGEFLPVHYRYLHARFRIANDTVSTRDTIAIPIELAELVLPPPLLQMDLPARVRMRLRWNATVATPLEGALQPSVQDGYHIEWIEARSSPAGFRPGDTIGDLLLIAALGELPSFRIEVDSVIWYDQSGNAIISSAEQEGGTIVFNDIWQDQWGVRLVSPNAVGLNPRVVPNPLEADAVVVFTPVSGDVLVVFELYDAMGNRVSMIVPTAGQRASGQIPFYRGTLPSGVYFLRMVYGSRSVVTMVVLQ